MKSIAQLREKAPYVLKRKGHAKQRKKLWKAYHGNRLKKWWSSYASWECCTIAELKDAEHVGHRMKGGHRHNHVRNAMAKRHKCKNGWRNCAVCGERFYSTHHKLSPLLRTCTEYITQTKWMPPSQN